MIRIITRLVSSMKFAIALLILISIASLIGTLIDQQEPYSKYVKEFGPFWADIFCILGIYNIYSSRWFLVIILFLTISILICIIRNKNTEFSIKIWKNKIYNLLLPSTSNSYRFNFTSIHQINQISTSIQNLLKQNNYKFSYHIKYTVNSHKYYNTNTMLIKTKHSGITNYIGYIFLHLAIVIICVGGLLDSNLIINVQKKIFNKTPIYNHNINQPYVKNYKHTVNNHILSAWNPSFRSYAWLPEGKQLSRSVINYSNGIFVQNLPITIKLKKFIIKYYSTGSPKLFASDVIVTDNSTGKIISSKISVNKPLTINGLSIYQSSFENSGSTLKFCSYPMFGSINWHYVFDSCIGKKYFVGHGQTIKFINLRPINIENISTTPDVIDTNILHKKSFFNKINEVFKLFKSTNIKLYSSTRDLGPSIQFKLYDTIHNQEYEFNNYMLPININGDSLFFTGIRSSSSMPFRYLRIPADKYNSVNEWMRIRAALFNPQLRFSAASNFAKFTSSTNNNINTIKQLRRSALNILMLFAGINNFQKNSYVTCNGGFSAIEKFIECNVPKNEQVKAANLLLRVLHGSLWYLWQVSREHDGQAPIKFDNTTYNFISNSLNAISDSFIYSSPIFLQLQNFKQVYTSIFQINRTPGRILVYYGSFMLICGICMTFYIQKTHVYLIVSKYKKNSRISILLFSKSRNIDINLEKEFEKICNIIYIGINNLSCNFNY